MRPILAQSWRIFWTFTVSIGVTIGAYRIDHSRAESARTRLAQSLSEQILTQFELLTAPGSLQATDRVSRAIAILNSGSDDKPLTLRLRPQQEDETLRARVLLEKNEVTWSRRLNISDSRVIELRWRIPESQAFGAISTHDSDLRLALLFLANFFALWFFGRGLFANSTPSA